MKLIIKEIEDMQKERATELGWSALQLFVVIVRK